MRMAKNTTAEKAPRINAIEFALFWDKADSPKEVADHFGTTVQRVKQKFYGMRKKNIPLKLFERMGGKLDVDEITAALRKAREERGEDPDAYAVTASEQATDTAAASTRGPKSTKKKAGGRK